MSGPPSVRILATSVLAAGLALAAPPARAFGVLTHLAIVDAAWDDTLVPAIRHRYPRMGEDDLRRAHAAAYGGALVQDMGYYPGGSRELADLLHYVRSADFVSALLAEARTPSSTPTGSARSRTSWATARATRSASTAWSR